MRKGIQIQRRQVIAIVLSSLILIELGAVLFFVILHFVSVGSFDNLSPADLVPVIAALVCIGIGVFAGKRSYTILTWRRSRRAKRVANPKKSG